MIEDKKEKQKISLFSKGIYWDENNSRINSILKKDKIHIETMEVEDIKCLVQELDRRLSQLWFKVSFESENNLVDYKPIIEKLKSQ